jgi:hypothetical protein
MMACPRNDAAGIEIEPCFDSVFFCESQGTVGEFANVDALQAM